MKRWMIWLLIIIIVVVIVLLAYFASRSSSEANNPSVYVIKQGNIVEEVQAAGYITPQHSIAVKSEIGGSVSKVFHDGGDYVKAGEPLVAIKPMPAPSDYASAKENVLEKTSALNAAQTNFNRYNDMLHRGLITTNYGDYITTVQAYHTAKEQLALSKQQLGLIETGQTVVGNHKINNTITAPISGYIMKRNVDVGDFVDPISSKQTATILFTIADMNSLMFQGYVDEADSNKIQVNMPAMVEVGAIPGLDLKGVLTKISLQSEQAGNASRAVDESSIFTHSPFTAGFQVNVTRLQIPKNVQLRDGYSATANIAVKSALNVPIIPERLLHFDGQKPYVYVPGKSMKTPKKVFVTLGISDGMNAQIESGVKIGGKVLDMPDPSDSD
jgi:HlyD family secretion protein